MTIIVNVDVMLAKRKIRSKELAEAIGITPAVKPFRLEQANEALQAIKDEDVIGSAVIVP